MEKSAMKCNLCGQEIPKEAEGCPHCQTADARDRIESLIKETIDVLTREIKTDKGRGELYFKMGNFYRLSGKFEEAIACYHKAMQDFPEKPEYHRSLGSTHAARGDYTAAEASMRKAAALAPHFADYRSDLGAALFKNRKYDEALSEFKEAIRLNPRYANAHNNLAMTYRKKGLHDEAEKEIRKAIELDPGNAIAEYALGQAYYSGGMFSQLRETAALDAKTLGDIYLIRRMHAQAIEHYAKAVEIHPNYADYHYALALAYDAAGRRGEAREELRKSLEINPGYHEAKTKLKEMEK